MILPEEIPSALDVFRQLLSVASPSGNEKQMSGLLAGLIDEMGWKAEIDAAGNVLVRLAGQDPSLGLCILAAHIDEIGVVVKIIHPDGSLEIENAGGLLPWKLGERPIEILGDHETIVGVTGFGAAHGSKMNRLVEWGDVKVITGLTMEQLKKAGVRPGSCGVPLRSQCGPVLFGNPADPLVAAWTFDDRMGVVALLRLLKVMKLEGIQPQHPTIIAFTTQEELGGQGARILAHRERCETFISIDGSPIPPESGLSLDGRPAIWSMDRLGQFDQDLLRFLVNAAVEAGTDLQPVLQLGAACDSSMVGATGGAARIADFGHVRENSHGYEVSRLSVFDNVLKILVQFIKTWK